MPVVNRVGFGSLKTGISNDCQHKVTEWNRGREREGEKFTFTFSKMRWMPWRLIQFLLVSWCLSINFQFIRWIHENGKIWLLQFTWLCGIHLFETCTNIKITSLFHFDDEILLDLHFTRSNRFINYFKPFEFIYLWPFRNVC